MPRVRRKVITIDIPVRGQNFTSEELCYALGIRSHTTWVKIAKALELQGDLFSFDQAIEVLKLRLYTASGVGTASYQQFLNLRKYEALLNLQFQKLGIDLEAQVQRLARILGVEHENIA